MQEKAYLLAVPSRIRTNKDPLKHSEADKNKNRSSYSTEERKYEAAVEIDLIISRECADKCLHDYEP